MKAWNWYQRYCSFEEMEHEYPFGTFRVGRSYQMFRLLPEIFHSND